MTEAVSKIPIDLFRHDLHFSRHAQPDKYVLLEINRHFELDTEGKTHAFSKKTFDHFQKQIIKESSFLHDLLPAERVFFERNIDEMNTHVIAVHNQRTKKNSGARFIHVLLLILTLGALRYISTRVVKSLSLPKNWTTEVLSRDLDKMPDRALLQLSGQQLQNFDLNKLRKSTLKTIAFYHHSVLDWESFTDDSLVMLRKSAQTQVKNNADQELLKREQVAIQSQWGECTRENFSAVFNGYMTSRKANDVMSNEMMRYLNRMVSLVSPEDLDRLTADEFKQLDHNKLPASALSQIDRNLMNLSLSSIESKFSELEDDFLVKAMKLHVKENEFIGDKPDLSKMEPPRFVQLINSHYFLNEFEIGRIRPDVISVFIDTMPLENLFELSAFQITCPDTWKDLDKDKLDHEKEGYLKFLFLFTGLKDCSDLSNNYLILLNNCFESFLSNPVKNKIGEKNKPNQWEFSLSLSLKFFANINIKQIHLITALQNLNNTQKVQFLSMFNNESNKKYVKELIS